MFKDFLFYCIRNVILLTFYKLQGYGGKASTYIACQAPLPEGVEEFWRMIWEQQCRVIIMLTMFEENGTVSKNLST